MRFERPCVCLERRYDTRAALAALRLLCARSGVARVKFWCFTMVYNEVDRYERSSLCS